MKNCQRVAVAAVAGLMLAVGTSACSSTQMTKTWKDPVAGQTPVSRIAVLYKSQDEAIRRLAEDEVASEMAAKATPSYKILEGVDVSNRHAVDEKLRQQGFDGLLIMQQSGVSRHVVDDMPSATFNNYDDWIYPVTQGPAVRTVVHVDSRLYSLPDERLIWSGSSQTRNPDSVQQMLDRISKAVAKSLQRSRLVI
jgi:hypothetical protein